MNKKDILVNEIKIALPEVVAYQQKKGYFDFDFGYNMITNTWECSFFDQNGDVVEEFNGTDSWKSIVANF